jgi:hypothetical protein
MPVTPKKRAKRGGAVHPPRQPQYSITRRRTTRKPANLNYIAKQRARNLAAYMSAKEEHLVPPQTKGLDEVFVETVREFAESQPAQEEHAEFTSAMRHLKRALDAKDIKKIIRNLNKISEIYGFTKYELAHFYIEDARMKTAAADAHVDELAFIMKNMAMQ